MILSDRDIEWFLEKKEIALEGYTNLQDQIQPNSIDVYLGPQIIEYRCGNINGIVYGCDPIEEKLIAGPTEKIDAFAIMPGRFYLGSTIERLRLGPKVCAKIEGKSSLGRRGIHVHSTAGWIDSGFEGQLTLEIHSVMPCVQFLEPYTKIAQICFYLLSSECRRPYGDKTRQSKYQGQLGPTPSKG